MAVVSVELLVTWIWPIRSLWWPGTDQSGHYITSISPRCFFLSLAVWKKSEIYLIMNEVAGPFAPGARQSSGNNLHGNIESEAARNNSQFQSTKNCSCSLNQNIFVWQKDFSNSDRQLRFCKRFFILRLWKNVLQVKPADFSYLWKLFCWYIWCCCCRAVGCEGREGWRQLLLAPHWSGCRTGPCNRLIDLFQINSRLY